MVKFYMILDIDIFSWASSRVTVCNYVFRYPVFLCLGRESVEKVDCY